MKNSKITGMGFLMLIMSFLAVGCSCHGEYCTVRIQNLSAYDVEINVAEGGPDLLIPRTLKIKSGKIFSASSQSDSGPSGWISVYAIIKFGVDVVTRHRFEDENDYHNFCFEGAYARNRSDEREITYTFTFTDADYEYAVEHPMQIPDYNLTILNVENRSSYDVEIITGERSSVLVPERMYVKNGETFTASERTDDDYLPWTAAVATVKFGADVSVTHRNADGDKYHNFCDPWAYVWGGSSGDRQISHTFVFTDADYEYAREHPAQE